jgi:DNA polymerase I-like protein with 3'-5' exonuclease and polymerase domains
VAHVHDELQVEARPQIAEEVGKIIVRSMQEAGEYFKFRVPITGEWKVGTNWAETH